MLAALARPLCHNDEHHVRVADLPLCTRCTGALLGLVAGLLPASVLAARAGAWAIGLALVLVAADLGYWAATRLGFPDRNDVRLLTGSGLGLAAALVGQVPAGLGPKLALLAALVALVLVADVTVPRRRGVRVSSRRP